MPAARGKDMTRRYIPDSLPPWVSALSSSSFLLILPDFVICRPGSRRTARSVPAACLAAANRESDRAWRHNRHRSAAGSRGLAAPTPSEPLLIGPLISPGFMVNATAAWPDIEPTSGTWPSGRTKSLVFTVAPSSLAARFRSCSALARSESSCVFWVSSVLDRSFLNSSSTWRESLRRSASRAA